MYNAYQARVTIDHIHLWDEQQRLMADLAIAPRTMYLISEKCPILTVQLKSSRRIFGPFDI